jgi:hypothetical protein
MESCLLKFTLTETTGIINTGWLLQECLLHGELYSNSDGMHDVFSFNMGNTMHFSLYRWTLYLTIRMIYLTRNITINLPRLNSMLKLCTDGSNRHFDAKVC